MFYNEIKREIIHSLIRLGGKANIKDLKESSQPLYYNNEMYEQALQEVSEISKSKPSNVIIKLKDS